MTTATATRYQIQIRTCYYGPSVGPWRLASPATFDSRAEALRSDEHDQAGTVMGMVDATEHNSYGHELRVVGSDSRNWIDED